MSGRRPVIAIDGQAGAGKSTLARRLAEALDLPYVNTGHMYRAVTLRGLREGVHPDDEPALVGIARTTSFDLDSTVRPPSLLIEGEPPEAELASPEVESTVSRAARHPEVRAVLREEQRRLAEGGAVVEGRDIGSVVLPDADAKLFLEADEPRRVARRAEERAVGERRMASELTARDAQDARTNPAVPAEDAVAIDTTDMDANEVFRTALAVIRARLAERGL